MVILHASRRCAMSGFKRSLNFLWLCRLPSSSWRKTTLPYGSCPTSTTRRQDRCLRCLQMQTGLVSLMVMPDSVAAASGGVEVDFPKVSFHYARVRELRGCDLIGARIDLCPGLSGRKQHATILHVLPFRYEKPRSKSLSPLQAAENPVEPIEQ